MTQAMDDKSNLSGNEAKLEEVDKSIVRLKEDVATGERFNRLYNNELFIEFITEGLLVNELNKLTTSLSMEPHNAESEELILVRLRSLKVLRNYLQGKSESLTNAKIRLVNEEQFKIELQNEEEVEYE